MSTKYRYEVRRVGTKLPFQYYNRLSDARNCATAEQKKFGQDSEVLDVQEQRVVFSTKEVKP